MTLIVYKCIAGVVLASAIAGAAELSKEERVATLQRAAALIDRGSLADAGALLTNLLTRSPADPLALNLLGVVRMREQRPQEAEMLFVQAVEKEPGLPGPHVNLAVLYGAHRYPDALAQLRQALNISPVHEQAKSVLRNLTKEAVEKLVKSGDNGSAMAIVEQARQLLPNDPELSYQLAIVAMQSKSYAGAEKAFRTALSERPGYAEAMYGLARACLAQNKAAEAESWMREYVKLRPDDASGQYGLGYVLMSEQKTADAQAAFEASVTLRPEQTESVFQLGEIAVRQGDDERAKSCFEKVLARDPLHAGALTEMAVFSFKAGRYQEAIGNLVKAVQRAPDYAKAHYYLALSLKKLHRSEEADREFAVATELQKKQPILEMPQ